MNWTSLSWSPYYITDLYDVTFGNGTFVAVGWGGLGNPNLYHSTNGIDWTNHSSSIANFYRVIYGAGLFVAVGDGDLPLGGTTNYNIYTSPDGMNWTPQWSGAPANDVQQITDVAYGGGRFVAVDFPGNYYCSNYYTSTTGSNWVRRPSPCPGSSVSYCKDRFFRPAGPGTNLVSTSSIFPPFISWITLTNDTGVQFGRMIYADGTYLALAGSKIFISTNGTNWVLRSTGIPSNTFLSEVTTDSRRFFAVGSVRPGPPVQPAAYISDPVVDLGITHGLPPVLSLSGLVGRSYRVDRNPGLDPNNWSPLATLTLTNSPSALTDSQATNLSGFYRAVLLP